MNISVKAVKTFRGHDGHGFECTLYVDGKKVGYAVDDGWGGGIQVDVPRPTHNAIIDYIKTLPPRICDGSGGVPKGYEFKMSLDFLISDLVNVALNQKHAKRMLARLVIVAVDGKMWEWVRKAGGHDCTTAIRKLVATKYPDGVILNDLPIADATPYLVA